MADIVTKIQFRQGTDAQRRTANTTGVLFSTGEPGYCIDTKRVFIGDGTTFGGNPVGIQNIGLVNTLFGGATNGFTTEALNKFTARGAALGDIIYDRDTRGIYALTGVTSFPPLSTDLVKYDTATLIDETMFQYNTSKQLQIRQGGVGASQIGFTAVDNITLQKSSYATPIEVKANGVGNVHLAKMNPFTVKINNKAASADPVDQLIYPNHVLGRTNTSTLTSVPFETIFKLANYIGDNGIIIDKTAAAPKFSIDTAVLSALPAKLYLNKATEVQASFSVTGNTILGGTLQTAGNTTVLGTIYCSNDIIAYSTSDITLKQNLKQISNPLSKLEKINGYTFDWKPGLSYNHLQGADVGISAQEVEEVIPEAVTTRKDGIKAVNYSKLVPLLIESIKSLKTEINDLKNEIRSSR